jgi:hypothetical protein
MNEPPCGSSGTEGLFNREEIAPFLGTVAGLLIGERLSGRKRGHRRSTDRDRRRIAVCRIAFTNSISLPTPTGVKNLRLRGVLLAAGAAWF